MAEILSNKDIKLVIESAGEKYRGSRFDWNGTVTQIFFKGVPLLSEEKKLFHRNAKIFGRGLHNEFGIRDCIGYDDVEVGGFFPKIGTGWLKKDEKPYFFYTQYEMEPLDFSIAKISDNALAFTCVSGERNGYSYTYTKTITLLDDGFNISYKIDNTGTKPLSTTEYVHNFFLPAHKKVDNHLVLLFNWQFDVNKLQTFNDAKSVKALSSNEGIRFRTKPKGEFFLGGVLGARTNLAQDNSCAQKEYKWTLTDNHHAHALISESVNFTPDGCDVWGHSGAISPELFYRFCANAGECVQWERAYRIKPL